jgi:dTDP-glucose 4,6-dehydratase
VRDHARAIDAILERGRVGEVYNVGGKNEWTNIDIVRRVCALIDEAVATDPTLFARFPSCPPSSGRSAAELITFVQDRPGHDRRYAINPAKIESELNFRPAETFESGIRRTVAWFLTNEVWWRSVMDGSYRTWLETQYQGAQPSR